MFGWYKSVEFSMSSEVTMQDFVRGVDGPEHGTGPERYPSE